jgi:hypothetical protein
MDLIPEIATLLRKEFDAEIAAGFPKLSRIPSSGVIKFLDYFAPLSPAERGPLLEVLAQLGAMHFFPTPQIAGEYEKLRTTNPALVRLGDAMQSAPFAYGLRYQDLRMSRMMLNDRESVAQIAKTRSTLDFEPRDDPPTTLVLDPDLRNAQPAKAPLLRKLLSPALSKLLSAKGIKRPGGEIIYDGSIGRTPISVSIIFSNRFGQLHYGVKTAIPELNIRAFRLAYETFWGANIGWDYMTEENAPRSIDLLCQLVSFVAGIVEQIGRRVLH